MIARVKLPRSKTKAKIPRTKLPRKTTRTTAKPPKLPPGLDIIRDGRTRSAMAVRRRLAELWLAVTDNDTRPLRPAEAAAIKNVVFLERKLDDELAAQAKGKSTGEDVGRVSSELRRQTTALGLSTPAPAQADVPTPEDGDKPQPESTRQNQVSLFAVKIERIRRNIGPIIRVSSLAEEVGAIDVSMEQLPHDEGAFIEAVVRRVVQDAREKERVSRPPTPEETISALEAEIEQLRTLLAAKESDVRARGNFPNDVTSSEDGDTPCQVYEKTPQPSPRYYA